MKTRTAGLIFSTVALIFSLNSFSQTQTYCPNLDFEDGDLNGWSGFYGDVWNINTNPTPGIINGRHTIVTGSATDPNTGNAVTIVAPGSIYSCQLGNDNVGCEAEKLTYDMLVTPESTLLMYRYAVVLQDPGHLPADQPQFELAVRDSVGNLVDPNCGYYQVTAAGNIPGFETFGNVRYKDWTAVGIDLSAFMNQTLTIEYTTKDCGLCGHFGYAYMDVACGPLEILTGYCAGDTNLTFTAPEGFTYLWNPGNDTNQSITISGSDTNTYTCILTSVNGCTVELTGANDPTIFNIEFNNTSCGTANFFDTSDVNHGSVVGWEWDFGDGNFGSGQNPTHDYANDGNYDVILVVTNSAGCKDTLEKRIQVYWKPDADFTYLQDCENGYNLTAFQDASIKTETKDLKYEWDFGSGGESSEQNPIVQYDIPSEHEVELIIWIDGDPTCGDTTEIDVNVEEIPQIIIPNVFTPNEDGYNDQLVIKNIKEMTAPGSDLVIFNRWGNLVYEATDYNNDWKGGKAPEGIYYYVFRYRERCNEEIEHIEKGYFTILDAR